MRVIKIRSASRILSCEFCAIDNLSISINSLAIESKQKMLNDSLNPT